MASHREMTHKKKRKWGKTTNEAFPKANTFPYLPSETVLFGDDFLLGTLLH
jgi:hypothetical protein